MTKVRKGQAGDNLPRIEFHKRFAARVFRSRVREGARCLGGVEDVAWDAYSEGRKAPRTHPAGPGFADPEYKLSDEWRADARPRRCGGAAAEEARRRRRAFSSSMPRRATTARAPARSRRPSGFRRSCRRSCGPSMSKSTSLDLSLITSDYAAPHPPVQGVRLDRDCRSATGRARAIPITPRPGERLDGRDLRALRGGARHDPSCTPVHWYQVPSVLKLLMDRLVCADGGNPDPTSTHGKDPARRRRSSSPAGVIPKHLAGAFYGLVVHGDVAGAEGVRRSLSDWLDWMGLIDAGAAARLDRFIGFTALRDEPRRARRRHRRAGGSSQCRARVARAVEASTSGRSSPRRMRPALAAPEVATPLQHVVVGARERRRVVVDGRR